MTEDEITAKIRADLERNVFSKWPKLQDPTVVPDEPCPCGGGVFWRTIGTTMLHCAACSPIQASATTAYWYMAGTQPFGVTRPWAGLDTADLDFVVVPPPPAAVPASSPVGRAAPGRSSGTPRSR